MHRIGYCRSHTSVKLHPTRRYPSTLALKTDSNTVADLVKHILKMPLHTQALHSISRKFSNLCFCFISSAPNQTTTACEQISHFLSDSFQPAHTAVIDTTVHEYCSSQFWVEQLCGLKISIDTLCGRWFEQHTRIQTTHC